jgi:hypothetical protein
MYFFAGLILFMVSVKHTRRYLQLNVVCWCLEHWNRCALVGQQTCHYTWCKHSSVKFYFTQERCSLFYTRLSKEALGLWNCRVKLNGFQNAFNSCKQESSVTYILWINDACLKRNFLTLCIYSLIVRLSCSKILFSLNPLKPKLVYILLRIQSVPQRKHNTSRLQRWVIDY